MSSENGSPLRVAIVGCGYFAQFHHDAWNRLGDLAQVVAVCDQDEAKALGAAKLHLGVPHFDDVAAMLSASTPDVLDIVTPPQTHAAIVRLAADRGIDVICQKPIAPTLAESQALVEMAEDAGIALAVHENFRFMPWFVEAKRLIGEGALGALHSIAFRMRPGDGQGPDAYLSRQPYFQKMPRFLIHETGIHFVDTFRCLMGEVRSVNASLRRVNPVIAGEDAGYVMFDFDEGTTGLLDGNRLNDHPAENTRLTMGEMWLEGTEGVLRLDGFGRLFLKPHGGVEARHACVVPTSGFVGDCVRATQAAIVEAWQAGETPPNMGRAYLRNVEIVEAIYRSSDEGRRVDI